jgi:hypothetical protein
VVIDTLTDELSEEGIDLAETLHAKGLTPTRALAILCMAATYILVTSRLDEIAERPLWQILQETVAWIRRSEKIRIN